MCPSQVKLWLPTQVTAGPGHCWQREQKEYMQKTVQRYTELYALSTLITQDTFASPFLGTSLCWSESLSVLCRNLAERETQRNSEPDPLDGQMLWVLWRHIR